MLKRTISTLILCMGVAASATAAAESYTLVAPFSAGSGPDVLARALADELEKQLGDHFVVVNKPGGNGIVGIQFLEKSPPENTIAFLDSTMLTVNPALLRNLTYSAKSFVPLSMVADTPFSLFINTSLNINSVSELIAYAKAHPGKLSYGSPLGVGHPGHLGMEAFKESTGTDMIMVPYKSSQTMLADMASGRIQLGWSTFASGRSFMETGKVKVIATGGERRITPLPDVPTVAEAGGPADLRVDGLLAVYALPGMSAKTRSKLEKALAQVVGSSAIQQRITGVGYENASGDGQAVTRRLDRELARYIPLIERQHIQQN
ncbi:Tripartite tricarboxylate transporter family receptor [Pigmentiphaga humi]|uniref:Tripartite tricarboxylate transporter family receptor n=1 Tax=Pigmentiphaga humi TaxID=2478468 RepID=A0A3P4B972_9BURK|nr:tripartite tricarboxylate transporter substrate binding protein [Pigmentiphaga humi]VCU71695.1 Tripartite tricarboxylate transporter family receptor [Pigmentiphaga humi]